MLCCFILGSRIKYSRMLVGTRSRQLIFHVIIFFTHMFVAEGKVSGDRKNIPMNICTANNGRWVLQITT